MKKNTAIIKKLCVVAIILVVVTFSIVAFIGIYLKNLNKKSNIINDYTLSTEFSGNREYKLTLDSSQEEKDVYVNENGEIFGEARDKEDTSTEVTAEETEGEATEGTAENTEGETPETTADQTENETTESTEKEEDKKTQVEGYTIEKRTIKSNEDSVLTKDSYIESKKIMEKKLESLGVSDYKVRLDEITGKMVIELPDDENANFLSEVAYSQGIFEVIDSQTGLKLLDNSNVKKAQVGSYSQNNKYNIYLQIYLDKEGTEILKNISNIYVEKPVEKEETSEENTNSTNENTVTDAETNTSENTNTTDEATNTAETDEPETKTDYVEVILDGTTISKTYFGEEMDGGIIQLTLSSDIDPTDVDALTEASKSATSMATILNSGKMPNKYSLESDDFLQSSINDNEKNVLKIVVIGLVLILSILIIIRFGLNGILGAILNIGYLALISLAVRYTNVIISISSIITVLLVIIINFGFMYKFLSELKNDQNAKKAYSKTLKSLYLVIMPVAIIAFVFSFMQNVSIIGIGMMLFWSLIIQVLYNTIFTRTVYVLNDK